MALPVRGSVAALVCYPEGRVEDVGLYLFDDLERLERWWQDRLDMLDLLDRPLGPGDCAAGVAGVETTVTGEVACYRSRGAGRIRWIDREQLLYGSLDMTQRDIAAAHRWWSANLALPGTETLPGLPPPCEAEPAAWTRMTRAPGFGTGQDMTTPMLASISASASGELVAVGQLATSEPIAWHSADGTSWRRADMPGSPVGCESCTPGNRGNSGVPRDVVAWRDGLVAVGGSPLERSENGLIWSSAGGVEWSAPDEIEDASLRGALSTSDTLAIVGVSEPRRRQQDQGFPTLWLSADGASWEAHLISDQRGDAEHVARSPEGIWLVSGSSLWRSEEGDSWTEMSIPGAEHAAGQGRPGPLSWSTGGFLLVVTISTSGGRPVRSELWLSPDGLTWTIAATLTSSVTALATGTSGWYAFTTPPTDRDNALLDVTPIVLLSADGQEWCRTEPEEFRPSGVVDASVAPDGRILAAGYRKWPWGGPAIWTGESASDP